MQNQEVEVPVSATKTSSGMILETRPNHEVVNTVANNITACQIPSTLSQSTQSFEESVAKLDQTNGRVRKISTTILISISDECKTTFRNKSYESKIFLGVR